MPNKFVLFVLGFLAGCGGGHAVQSEFQNFFNACDKATIRYETTGPVTRRVFTVVCRETKYL